jgi:hypothetical protein
VALLARSVQIAVVIVAETVAHVVITVAVDAPAVAEVVVDAAVVAEAVDAVLAVAVETAAVAKNYHEAHKGHGEYPCPFLFSLCMRVPRRLSRRTQLRPILRTSR